MTRLEEVGRVKHLLQLRERLGLDTNPAPTTKTEKDVCNLAARASTSPVHMVIPPSPQTPIKDAQAIVLDRDYTQREQELLLKCIKLIQGRIGFTKTDVTGDNNTTTNSQTGTTLQVDASPGDEGCADLNMSYISGNSLELVSPDRPIGPDGWEAPAPALQPTLPLRLYVPELEEIRISPVVARKGYLNVLEHGGSGWKKRWVVSILHFALWDVNLLIKRNRITFFVDGATTICTHFPIGERSSRTGCSQSRHSTSRMQ